MPASKTEDVITDPADIPEGGEVFDPEAEQAVEAPAQDDKEVAVAGNQCPDCEGRGIRNPNIDIKVCATCEGSGRTF